MSELHLNFSDAISQHQFTVTALASQTIQELTQALVAQEHFPAPARGALAGHLFHVTPAELVIYDPLEGVFAPQKTLAEYGVKTGDVLFYHLFPVKGLTPQWIRLESGQAFSEVAQVVLVEWAGRILPVIIPRRYPSEPEEALDLFRRVVFEQIAEITGVEALPVNYRSQRWNFAILRTDTWVTDEILQRGLEVELKPGEVVRPIELQPLDEPPEDDVDGIVILSEESPTAEAEPQIEIRDGLLDDIQITALPPVEIKGCKMTVMPGEIAWQASEAIVIPANPSLNGTGEPGRMVFAEAGPHLEQASRMLAPCNPGQAVLTPGYCLPAKWVIQAVVPAYHDGSQAEFDLLAGVYRASLAIALASGFTSLAIAPLGIGEAGYPVAQAAAIAVRAIQNLLEAGEVHSLVNLQFIVTSAEVQEAFLDAIHDHR